MKRGTHARRGLLAFVVGTGTDVGKTVATAALCLAARRRGLTVRAIKPVQTGCPAGAGGSITGTDAAVYADACPDARAAVLEAFAPAASPHLAARIEGRRIAARSLADALLARRGRADVTFAEGAGGLLAPLNDDETLADVIALTPPAGVILVAANGLGAINHTLLTLEALRARGVRPAALVATHPVAVGGGVMAKAVARDNLGVFRRLGKVACLAEIPHYPALQAGHGAGADDRRAAWNDAATRLERVVDALLADADPAAGSMKPWK